MALKLRIQNFPRISCNSINMLARGMAINKKKKAHINKKKISRKFVQIAITHNWIPRFTVRWRQTSASFRYFYRPHCIMSSRKWSLINVCVCMCVFDFPLKYKISKSFQNNSARHINYFGRNSSVSIEIIYLVLFIYISTNYIST